MLDFLVKATGSARWYILTPHDFFDFDIICLFEVIYVKLEYFATKV